MRAIMRKEPSSQENVTEERQSDQILECSQENNVAHGHRKCTDHSWIERVEG